MTRDELIQATGLSGGGLSKILKNLERCDFIAEYAQFGVRTSKCIYRLQDFFTLFHLKFVQGEKSYDPEYWLHHFASPQVRAWEGLTFELVCFMHLAQIKKTLGISGMATAVSSWRYVPGKSRREDMPQKGAQIDLLIDRADNIIHLCEMKFSSEKFRISKEYEQQLRERMDCFRQVTRTRKALVHTFVTVEGLANSTQNSLVHSEITGEDLFQ